MAARVSHLGRDISKVEQKIDFSVSESYHIASKHNVNQCCAGYAKKTICQPI